MQAGKSSIRFEKPPLIAAAASVVGEKEGRGPLGGLFDMVERDPMFGMESWEEAESEAQRRASMLALKKGGLESGDVRYLFAGDLLGQLIATSFGIVDLGVPLFGLYGACSTMGEGMVLGAMTAAAGYADRVMALASSHFASAERQFRFPLAYGNQRPYSSTWTVTGCGCVVIENSDAAAERAANPSPPLAKITAVTTGKIIDLGTRDSMNMGAAMAPAAVDTILQHLRDLDVEAEHYDKIITGDLGVIGRRILLDFMAQHEKNLTDIHMDCGIEIFDGSRQDTHAGGSGCGCSAVTLCAYILPNIFRGVWKRVLFVPTGALLSPVSFNEGQSIPGIAHAVAIEAVG